jgi:Fe-only nitrogenase accessory protein AnfO
MEIATYLDSQGRPASFGGNGWLRVFEQTPQGWQAKREVPLTIDAGMRLTELVGRINHSIAALGECRVALLGDLRGMLRALLEEHGYRTWKSSGALIEQLDNVAMREAELAAMEAQEAQARTREQQAATPGCAGLAAVSERHLKINLAEILQHTPGHASRDVVLPVLREGRFSDLEIECEHLPRWFDSEIKALGLLTEIREPATPGGHLFVTVRPNPASVTAALNAAACADDCSHGSCGHSSIPGVFDA